MTLASIVITNHNYGRYLAEAIDSALGQTYPHVEVLVVDDGSEDDSREVIARYGGRVTAIFKCNGGQCSSINAGFRRSRGDVVLFLDADDVLLADAVARHVERLQNGAVRSCGYMVVVGADGVPTGDRIPQQLPASGDYRQATLEHGIDHVQCSFTSGNAWSRSLLEQVLPLPLDDTVGADGYLTAVDQLFGRLEFIHEPVVQYRIHGVNKGPISYRFDLDYLRDRLRRKEHRIAYAEAWVERLGLETNPARFRRYRDWRLVLMQHAVSLMDENSPRVPLGEYLSAPFRRRPIRPLTCSAAAACLVAIRVLPLDRALGLTRRVLRWTYTRRLVVLAWVAHASVPLIY